MIKSKEECFTEGFYDPKGRLMWMGDSFPLTQKELVFAYIPKIKFGFPVITVFGTKKYCAIIQDVEELKKYSIYCPKLSERKVVAEFVGDLASCHLFTEGYSDYVALDNADCTFVGFTYPKADTTEITFQEFCEKFNVEPPKDELMSPEQVYYAYRSGKVEFRLCGVKNPASIQTFSGINIYIVGEAYYTEDLEMSTDQGKTWTKPIVGGG